MPNRLGVRDIALSPPARGQPGPLVGVGAGGVRGGATGCAGAAERRYAACHWCHVMAHESFEDDTTAAYLNEHFVSIKVDREERPDVDAVYMQATTAMTGQGGWPMTSCSTTTATRSSRAPTSRPAAARPAGVPAGAGGAGRRLGNQGEDVRRVAGDAARAPGSGRGLPARGAGRTASCSRRRWRRWRASTTQARGGFGGAPKFPPSMVLEFLLRRIGRPRRADARRHAGGDGPRRHPRPARRRVRAVQRRRRLGRAALREDALRQRAAAAGVRRARTDVGAWAGRGDRRLPARRAADRRGRLRSALDADSEGVEGTFYVWTPAQLVEALGPDDGAWAARLLSVTDAGTFEHGSSTLQLREDPDDLERWFDVQRRLRAARAERVRPARDDKVVAAWNGLAISGLVRLCGWLGEPTHLGAAVAAGELLAGCTSTAGGCGGCRAMASSASPRVCWRTTAVWPPASSTSSRPPATRSGSSAPGAARHRPHPLPGRRRRLLRHRRRRRGAGRPAPRPQRQREPFRASPRCCMRSHLHGAHRVDPAPRRRGGGAGHRARLRAGAAVRRLDAAAADAMLEGPLEVAVIGPPGAERDALATRARAHPTAVVVVADGPVDGIPLLAGRTRSTAAGGVRLPRLRLRAAGDHGRRPGGCPVALTVTALL